MPKMPSLSSRELVRLLEKRRSSICQAGSNRLCYIFKNNCRKKIFCSGADGKENLGSDILQKNIETVKIYQ